MKKENECCWLNKEFGKGYYICNAKFKVVSEEDCEECQKEDEE